MSRIPVIELFAKALWIARENRKIIPEDRRAWDKYKEGEEEYDCTRFEYNRQDHRMLARDALDLIERDGNLFHLMNLLDDAQRRKPMTASMIREAEVRVGVEPRHRRNDQEDQ